MILSIYFAPWAGHSTIKFAIYITFIMQARSFVFGATIAAIFVLFSVVLTEFINSPVMMGSNELETVIPSWSIFQTSKITQLPSYEEQNSNLETAIMKVREAAIIKLGQSSSILPQNMKHIPQDEKSKDRKSTL